MDSPLLGRYQGSLIISYEYKSFDEFTVPLSTLEAVQDTKRRDNHNNRVFEPKNRKTVEGEHWRLVYLVPENVSLLEVVRNYQTEIRKKGGKILPECVENVYSKVPVRLRRRGYPVSDCIVHFYAIFFDARLLSRNLTTRHEANCG